MHLLPLPCVCSVSHCPWLNHRNVRWWIQFMKLIFWWLSHAPIVICLSAQILSLASCFWTLSVCSLPYIFIVLRVDAVYVQVCNVAHWRSSRTSAVVPALPGQQEMELLAMTWMRSVHHCFQVDDDLFLFMLLCITEFTIRYCRSAPISFTISVCVSMCNLRTVDWIFMKLDIKEFY